MKRNGASVETLMLIVGRLILLVVGGELLVRGSVRVAERMGVSQLLIGLTLVGFGTSTPELVTSVQAALIGSPGIAIGNIVGSNIANILLILGLAAILSPIPVQPAVLRRDSVIVVAVTLLLAAASWTIGLNRPVGVVFVLSLVAYISFAYVQERDEPLHHTAALRRAEAFEQADPALRPREAVPDGRGSLLLPALIALGGLALIILGGRLLVDGAVNLARSLGMSEAVIGLTIVAVGTSMPELVTSVIAAVRRQTELALGNVLGSNIYNILGIGGVTALASPTPVPAQIANFDNPVMLAASLALLFFAATGMRVSRGEGGLLFAGYVVYIAGLLKVG